MSWPLLLDGTVDWYTVFTDADSGLLPLIERADSPQKLHACFHVVICGLYSRQTDGEIRQRYMDAVGDYLAGDNSSGRLIGMRTKIRVLLNRVMNDRIDRAQRYAMMARGIDERRLPDDDGSEEILNELIGDAAA